MAPRRSSGGSSSSSSGSSNSGSGGSGNTYPTPDFDVEATAGAIVFMILYFLALPYYFQRARGNPTPVFTILTLFCAIRLTGFGLRVAVDGTEGATKLGLFIGWWVLYDVGIFALLYAVYILILNRDIMSGHVKNSISRIPSIKHLIRFALGVAVLIGIAAWGCYSRGVIAAWALQKASVIIFLFVTAMLAIQTAFQIQAERTALGPEASSATYIPCMMIILLLIRGIYVTFTTFRPDSLQTNAEWYSLAAAPELLAVFLFVVPSLVPRKEDLVISRTREHEKGSGVVG